KKLINLIVLFFFFQAEDGIRDFHVTGVQTCALPILVILSTNARSWEITITALAELTRKSSNHSILSMSIWLVGSSSSIKSGFFNRILASSIRMRHPPENSAV